MERTEVLVALSGGVDSAVAAALLQDQGHDVAAVHLRMREPDARSRDDAEAAQAIALHLGIPLHTLDIREAFRRQVVDYFVAEYGAGRTPNPCTVCNPQVKFRSLLALMDREGAACIATGHYAAVRRRGAEFHLYRGQDRHKDQSYFLYRLGQSDLAHIAFPLGDLTKERVRSIALSRGLPVQGATESQDACFIPEGDYRAFLSEVAPGMGRPGLIRDGNGLIVGTHHGLPAYTVGQRKGLGISARDPLYVVEIDPTRNVLVVGSATDLLRDSCAVTSISYVSGVGPSGSFGALAQVRHGSRPVPALVSPRSDSAAHVRFSTPVRAVAPGQSLVLYEGDRVIGGGTIASQFDRA